MRGLEEGKIDGKGLGDEDKREREIDQKRRNRRGGEDKGKEEEEEEEIRRRKGMIEYK